MEHTKHQLTRRVSWIAASLLILFTAFTSLAQSQTFTPPTSSPTGFWNAIYVDHDDYGLGQDLPNEAYLGLRMSGTSWNAIETSKGVYNWTPIDNYTSKGGNFLYTFQNTPAWANNSHTYLPPTSLQDYYDFVTAFMVHVCPTTSTCKIKNFESWNEFNDNGYWDASYATLATMSANAAKIVKQYCTNCQFGAGSVSAGGVGYNDVETNNRNTTHPGWTFYDESLAAFLADWKADVAADNTLPEPDFISWHAYSAKATSSTGVALTPQPMPEYVYSGNGLGAGGDNGSSLCTTANASPTTNGNCIDSIITQATKISALTSSSTYGVQSKPVWATEGGFNALYSMANSDNHNTDPSTPCHANGNPPCTQDVIRAAYVARWLIALRANNVARAYWYAWDEPCFGTLFGSSANGVNSVCTLTGSNPAYDEQTLYHQKTLAGLAWDQVQLWLNGASAPGSCAENSSTHIYSCTVTRTTPAGYTGLIVWYTTWLGSTTYTPPTGYTQYRTLSGSTPTAYTGGSITLGSEPIIFEKKS